MIKILTLLLTLVSTVALAKQDIEVEEDGLWPMSGYIGIGAVILIVVIIVLVKRQHRKFNE